jgi:tetratricopeptide (TPR) repeat protein
MAYVRRRGNQLAIVHGEREEGTGKVRQRILFTIYSKAEALEILGRNDAPKKSHARMFEHLLEREHADLKLNWKAIRRAIEENMADLPEVYAYRAERLRARFREDLCAFAKQIILADPQDLMSSAQLIQEHRHELEYLAEKIRWRLELRDQKESEWNQDNPFYWRFALQGRDVPPDTEEHAAGYYERREYDRARAVFRLLTDCFDGYAEGYNYLGLIALEQDRLDDAIRHFEKTIELGRKLFPTRIAKKRYWSDHATRPYMRGLRNLALALNQAGRYDEALAICDRLENECADDASATAHRATIFLNTRRWSEAAEAARRLTGLWPDENLIVAFACYELGRGEDVLPSFLHAALSHPRATRMVLGERMPPFASGDDARDHNAGVSFRRSLHAYLGSQSRAAKKFFRDLVHDPRVAKLMDESIAVVRRWHAQHPTGEREAFDRMNHLKSREFAVAEAHKLRDLVGTPGKRGVAVH